MRTSSFAMSDGSEFRPLREQPSAQHLESLRLRKAYSATQGDVVLVEEAGVMKKKWRNGSSEGTPENLDYLDEKDFRNTDRYLHPFPLPNSGLLALGLLGFEALVGDVC
jgi:hypothetical protein